MAFLIGKCLKRKHFTLQNNMGPLKLLALSVFDLFSWILKGLSDPPGTKKQTRQQCMIHTFHEESPSLLL